MTQIRGRIADRRGVDYTEQEVRQLASARLEKLFDPEAVRTQLLEQIKRAHMEPNRKVAEDALFGSDRGWLRAIRKLLRPVLSLFIDTRPLAEAALVRGGDLFAQAVHELVLENTRLILEIKKLRMRIDSLSARLDFHERRARTTGTAAEPRPAAPAEAPRAAGPQREEDREGEGPAARARRRRRRRGRRGTGQQGAAGEQGGPAAQAAANEVPPGEAVTAAAAENGAPASAAGENAGRDRVGQGGETAVATGRDDNGDDNP